MSISRRQFLRACMYAAPAAVVAPKAISYFLPPQLSIAGVPLEWDHYPRSDVNVAFFENRVWAVSGQTICSSGDQAVIELLERRMKEAYRSMETFNDELAKHIYRGAADPIRAAIEGTVRRI